VSKDCSQNDDAAENAWHWRNFRQDHPSEQHGERNFGGPQEARFSGRNPFGAFRPENDRDREANSEQQQESRILS
jgi:hypothetical protein